MQQRHRFQSAIGLPAAGLGGLTAAILAGGAGTRLRSVVGDRPKALAPVHDRPYLLYLLDWLADNEVRNVVLLTGHHAGKVRHALGETYRELRLIHSAEPSPLGTGGAIRRALPHLVSSVVLVLNGDSWCDVDLAAFHAFHARKVARLSLVLAVAADAARFGRVQVAADGRVQHFAEKTTDRGGGWINAGVYLMDRSLIEEIPDDRPVSLERDLLPAWIDRRERVHGFFCTARFLDIGTPESYAEAATLFQPAGVSRNVHGALFEGEPMLTPTRSDFCFLKDQKPISQEAFASAQQLRTQVGALVASREDYLRRMRRNPEIHLPHGNWELPRQLYRWYQTVMDGDYEVINNLRLFTQVFTGFQLASLSRCPGKPVPQAVPADLDEQLAVLACTPGPYVDWYQQTIAHLPEVLHLTPPNVFGEVGWVANGKIINHDTHAYLERVVLLAECGKLWELRNRTPEASTPGQGPWRRPRILEIGGGFGGLAYHLRKLVPHARYVLVDIPEALVVSSIYLSTLYPELDNVLVTPDQLHLLHKDSAGFTFVPNYLFDECCTSGRPYDLVINTLSMSEMTERQVSYYADGIRRLLGRDGVFFEQNQDNRPVGMLDARLVLARHLPLCLPLGSFVMPVLQGQPHLWAAAHVKPYGWRPSSAVCQDGRAALLAPGYRNESCGQPKVIEEDYFGIKVIYYRGGWYGLPQGTGPFDPARVANKDYPLCFTADSKEWLMKTIRSRCGC